MDLGFLSVVLASRLVDRSVPMAAVLRPEYVDVRFGVGYWVAWLLQPFESIRSVAVLGYALENR